MNRAAAGLALALCGLAVAAEAGRHAWPVSGGSEPLGARIPPPSGFTRVPAEPGSFEAFLRDLPLLPGRPPVLLFSGSPKGNQQAHHAVVDMDVGSRDLQQCADAVMRLRAEWQWETGRAASVSFRLTSGDALSWADYRRGLRPVVKGSSVRLVASAAPADSHAGFRQYLDAVFTWAGSASLDRDTVPVADPGAIQPGDLYVHGGSPGHAVLVVDVAEAPDRSRVFLLAQSYMPAQQIHVLRNPEDPALSPWYRTQTTGTLATPEWTFAAHELHRFP